MGGNALTKTKTRRYQAEEFRAIRDYTLLVLETTFPGRRSKALESYRSKEDFGDLDIMFDSSGLTVNLREVLNKVFEPNEIVKNGGVYSFNVEELQVDLICQTTENYTTAYNYYRYSDLGNLMGRVAHKLGFKLGHDGLTLILRESTHQYAEITVTKDWAQALRFLDYDPDRFSQGFDTLEEIFEYATSSKFFNKAIYEYDNRNHTARVRDAKRAAYRSFLEYLETKSNLPAYPHETTSELGGRVIKTEFMERAYEFFPDLKFDYEMALALEFDRQTAKKKFNGQLVSEVTNLTDRALGEFMQVVRKAGTLDVQGVLAMSDTQVRAEVMRLFNEYIQGTL